MILQIVSVFDRGTEAFGRPVFVRALGEAVRSFADEAASSESVISKHPSDYELYKVGTFDDATGALDPIRPERLARGEDYVQK